MRLAILALVAAVSAFPNVFEERAELNCEVLGLQPYCCEISVSVPDLEVSIGIECVEQRTKAQKSKPQDQCLPPNSKLCCQTTATTIGPITLCDIPDE